MNSKAKPVNLILVSKEFAAARDAAGIVPPAGKTPTTFHEQRSLSERLYRAQGSIRKFCWGIKHSQPLTDTTMIAGRNGPNLQFNFSLRCSWGGLITDGGHKKVGILEKSFGEVLEKGKSYIFQTVKTTYTF